MTVPAARPATAHDLPALVALYRELEAEMTGLKPIWNWTDGLPEPVEGALEQLIGDGEHRVLLGEFVGVPAGFLVWRPEALLPQADGARMAVIHYIFTSPDMRQIGVGEAMAALFLSEAADAGITLFDAIVPPGHRHAKNFFESLGFKARRIVMHRDDREGEESDDVG